ncbi:MAG: folate-binding protein [Opitutus sp.]|nr:folate-binding protein [Opitutus sp.]
MIINISTYPTFYWWKPVAWLRIHGEDAANFLQGQFSNDLRLLERASAVYGLWLNVKGKVLADSFVLRGGGPNEYWIGSYFSPAAVIRERLEAFVIADDVAIEDATAEWVGVSILGEGTGARLAARPPGGFAFPGRRTKAENVEWIFPAAAFEAVSQQFSGATERSAGEMERDRILAGIPAVPVDVGPADLPNEAGLEGDAISYTKGCYLGQEVMARLKAMGQVRRRLLRVTGRGGEIPVLPARLFAGGRAVGELRSAVADGVGGYVGLAMVSLVYVTAGAALTLAADAPATVHVEHFT